jgi:hypothetical protein
MKPMDATKPARVGIDVAILGLKGTSAIMRKISQGDQLEAQPDRPSLRALQKRVTVLRRALGKLDVEIDRQLERSTRKRGRRVQA